MEILKVNIFTRKRAAKYKDMNYIIDHKFFRNPFYKSTKYFQAERGCRRNFKWPFIQTGVFQIYKGIETLIYSI